MVHPVVHPVVYLAMPPYVHSVVYLAMPPWYTLVGILASLVHPGGYTSLPTYLPGGYIPVYASLYTSLVGIPPIHPGYTLLMVHLS